MEELQDKGVIEQSVNKNLIIGFSPRSGREAGPVYPVPASFLARTVKSAYYYAFPGFEKIRRYKRLTRAVFRLCHHRFFTLHNHLQPVDGEPDNKACRDLSK